MPHSTHLQVVAAFPTRLALAFHLLVFGSLPVHAWINYPPDGFATVTHYDMPRDYITSCGCMPASTHYPTAAMSQMAYGSSNAYGPACGKCFKLSLLNTFLSNPPFYPPSPKSIVVKVTDLCPLTGDGWCSGTETKTNPGGQYLNFDLAFPSQAIPSDFFPSNASYYGYTDFGVWNISYQTVSCDSNWAGSKDQAALGSTSSLGPESACCPANPTGNVNDTCPSYSDNNGIPPDTTNTGSSCILMIPTLPYTLMTVAVAALSLGLDSGIPFIPIL